MFLFDDENSPRHILGNIKIFFCKHKTKENVRSTNTETYGFINHTDLRGFRSVIIHLKPSVSIILDLYWNYVFSSQSLQNYYNYKGLFLFFKKSSSFSLISSFTLSVFHQ